MNTNRNVPPPDLGLRAELWNSPSEDQLLERLPASPHTPSPGSAGRSPPPPAPAAPVGPGQLRVMPPPPPGSLPPGARSRLHTHRDFTPRPSLAPGVPIPRIPPGHSCDNRLSSCLPRPVSCPCLTLAPCSSSGNNPPTMLQVQECDPRVASRGAQTKSGPETEPRTSTVRHMSSGSCCERPAPASAGLPHERSRCPQPGPPRQTPWRVPAPGARREQLSGFRSRAMYSARLMEWQPAALGGFSAQQGQYRCLARMGSKWREIRI